MLKCAEVYMWYVKMKKKNEWFYVRTVCIKENNRPFKKLLHKNYFISRIGNVVLQSVLTHQVHIKNSPPKIIGAFTFFVCL